MHGNGTTARADLGAIAVVPRAWRPPRDARASFQADSRKAWSRRAKSRGVVEKVARDQHLGARRPADLLYLVGCGMPATIRRGFSAGLLDRNSDPHFHFPRAGTGSRGDVVSMHEQGLMAVRATPGARGPTIWLLRPRSIVSDGAPRTPGVHISTTARRGIHWIQH